MEITVSDPVKHSEGMNAYVTYKVTTKTDLERFDSSHFYVHRRYSDFVWLQEQLAEAYPGLIIPPLPEKQVMRRFNEPFLSQRQRALEKFLSRIASHELLRDNMYVKAFLEVENLEATKGSVAKQGKKNDQSFWQWASQATSSLSNKMAGGPSHLPKTEEDVKFDEARMYIDSLEPQINNVHKHTHTLVEKGKDMAQALFDFGLAFTLLGQAEADALGDAMAQLGQCADKLSRITAVEADKEAQFFDEPIRDYVRLVRQVKATLDVRVSKLQAYDNLIGEVQTKKQTRDRLASQPAGDPQSHAHKLGLAEEELKRSEQQLENAKEEYEVVTKRVLTEIDRFKREKLVDFKSIVLDYVQLQIEYNQQVEQSWREVLPSLQALNIQQSGSHGPTGQLGQAPAAAPIPARADEPRAPSPSQEPSTTEEGGEDLDEQFV
uniref:PX domain-containing protein n=1 Tax=Mucochytrium quahogii TaxID=96639 RepID=A0A7S2WCE5_9STRA